MPPLDFPSSNLTIGQLFAGPNNVQWQWDGSKWLGTPNTLGPIIVAASPPTFQSGQLWWDSTGGNLYLGYDDGNTQQWVPASNITGLANAATTMDVDKALGNVGRNLIHNSRMEVRQRGSGPWTASGAYTADRWVQYVDTNAVSTAIGGANDAARAAIGDENVEYQMNINVTGSAAPTAYAAMSQSIEDVWRLSGKTVILSFWASSAPALKLGVSFDQSFGTGGSPSATVAVAAQTITLTGSWVRYSLTFAIPSAAGKTRGSNLNDCTRLYFWLSSGTGNASIAGNPGVQTGLFGFWGVQLEIVQPGQTVPTKLEKRDPVLELQQCQRFYCTGLAYCTAYSPAGGYFGCTVSLPTPMRAVPSPVNFTGTTYSNASGIQVAGATGTGGFGVAALVTGTGSANFTTGFNASADL